MIMGVFCLNFDVISAILFKIMADLNTLKKDAFEALERVKDSASLEAFRNEFLARKGKIPLFLRSIAELPVAERPKAGEAGNALRRELEEALTGKEASFGTKYPHADVSALDVSRPGKRIPLGHVHVLSQTLSRTREIFAHMGFSAVDGPEVETEWNNFDALNIPKDHPARDMQDTFWLKQLPTADRQRPEDRLLLRTHTSGIQVRYMKDHQPPLRLCCTGKCYRRDATDATHDYQFHQVEMLCVDRNINVGHLKWVVKNYLSAFFEKDVDVRLRPSYFAFVEPGFEFDMTCIRCNGKGCTMCKKTGWIELGGAGMVNQAVFEAIGYARSEWTGMAFGFGLERLAILKHRIPDIRLMFGGDLRFIEQF
jgi:phenylalanyl-tRNA synthetase alpha chain